MDDLEKAKEALAMAREQLRLVDNAVEHAMISMDLDRKILSWNPGAENLIGISSSEAIGQTADVIFTPEDRALGIPLRETQTALVKGRAADERWHMRKDGSRFWGSGVMLPMRIAEGGEPLGFLKIFRDETIRKQSEEALKSNRQQLADLLLEAQKAREDAEAANRAKDRILAVISHELRTPLTPIILGTQLLARRNDLPQDVQEVVVDIRKNVDIEAHFIDELLDVSRIVHGKMELALERVDVHAAVESAVQISKADVEGKSQKLVVRLDATDFQIEGDSKRVQQVAWNLIKNASKFSPERGAIFVETRNGNEGLHLIVRDTGIGIQKDQLRTIFDTFVQIHTSPNESGGLGLGLSIAKGVVEAHGGNITAESDGLGYGSTFIVWFPLKSAKRKRVER